MLPDGGSQLTVTSPTGSVAVTVQLTGVPSGLPASTVILFGTVSSGLVWSSLITVTVNEAVAVLPAASAAVHVTAVSPIGKNEPGAGTQSTDTEPSRSSVAVAVYATIAPFE